MASFLEGTELPVPAHVLRHEAEEIPCLFGLAGVTDPVPLPERRSRREHCRDAVLLLPLPARSDGPDKGFLVQAVAGRHRAADLPSDFLDRRQAAAAPEPVHRRDRRRHVFFPQVLEPEPLLPYNLFRHRYVLSDVSIHPEDYLMAHDP